MHNIFMMCDTCDIFLLSSHCDEDKKLLKFFAKINMLFATTAGVRRLRGCVEYCGDCNRNAWKAESVVNWKENELVKLLKGWN